MHCPSCGNEFTKKVGKGKEPDYKFDGKMIVEIDVTYWECPDCGDKWWEKVEIKP